MRERGLKFGFDVVLGLILSSLPVRERGLKWSEKGSVNDEKLSLPVRERGLKCNGCQDSGNLIKVAPRAGAWIEIVTSPSRTK